MLLRTIHTLGRRICKVRVGVYVLETRASNIVALFLGGIVKSCVLRNVDQAA
jgi:hypothetical protein